MRVIEKGAPQVITAGDFAFATALRVRHRRNAIASVIVFV